MLQEYRCYKKESVGTGPEFKVQYGEGSLFNRPYPRSGFSGSFEAGFWPALSVQNIYIHSYHQNGQDK